MKVYIVNCASYVDAFGGSLYLNAIPYSNEQTAISSFLRTLLMVAEELFDEDDDRDMWFENHKNETYIEESSGHVHYVCSICELEVETN